MNTKDLKKSLILAVIITVSVMGFWLGIAKISIGAYNEKTLTRITLGENSKVFKTFVIELGTDTIARIIAGTSSMVFTGTSSYQTQPRIEFDGATGLWSFKNAGGTQTTAFGTLTPSYADANYINKTGGAGSATTLEGPTLTGVGTTSGTLNLTGTLSASGTNISGTEVSYLDATTSNIQTQINSKQASLGYTALSENTGSVTSVLGSQSVNALNDTNIAFNEGDFVKISGGLLVAGSSSTAVPFGNITGTPTNNSFFTATPGINKVPYTTNGNLDNWVTGSFPVLKIPATSTAQGTSTTGDFRVNTSSAGTGRDNINLYVNFDNPGSSTFTDSSLNAYAITSHANAIGTITNASLGVGAVKLDGDGDAISIADNNSLNGDNFMISTFLHYDGAPNNLGIFNHSSDGSNYISLYAGAGATILRWIVYSGGVEQMTNDYAWSPGSDTTYFLALVKVPSGTTSAYGAYINGSQIGGTITDESPIPNIAGTMTIGWAQATDNYFNGYIDEFRIGSVTSVAIPTEQVSHKYTEYKFNYKNPFYGTVTETLSITSPGTNTTKTTNFDFGVSTSPYTNYRFLAGKDNTSIMQIRVNDASTDATDTFIEFQDSAGNRIGDISSTGSHGVLAYNGYSSGEKTIIEDETEGLELYDVLEKTGEPIIDWKVNRVVRKEVIETEKDANGNIVYIDTGTTTVEKKVRKSKKYTIQTKIEGYAPQPQIVKSKVCSTRQSQAAWGLYSGKDNLGAYGCITGGTFLGKVANKGFNVKIGDYLISSDIRGMLELQGDNVKRNYTLAKSSEDITWQNGEQWRLIAIEVED